MPVSRPCVLLVHGAWHGGWCWAELQSKLDSLGIASYAIDLPGRPTSTPTSTSVPAGLAGDAEAVIRLVEHLSTQDAARSVVLVGHSYGGAVVSASAPCHPSIVSAIFVAAFALEAEESVNGFLRSAPREKVGLSEFMRPQPDGSINLEGDLAQIYGDIDPQVAAACVQRLTPQPPDTFSEPTVFTPLGTMPTTYVVCADDDAVHPTHQRLMAQRCDQVVELASGHFPMLSHPSELAAIIADAVGQASQAVEPSH